MTAPLYAIGRFCSRHHYPVIGVWLVLAIALRRDQPLPPASKTSENLTLPGTGSTIATELLEDNLPEQAYGSNPLVLRSAAGRKLTEPKYAAAIEETAKRLKALARRQLGRSARSARRARNRSAKTSRSPTSRSSSAIGPGEINEEEAEGILDAAAPARKAGVDTSIGAYVGQQLSKPATEISEAIGLAAAVIILLFAFGTATAMMLPIVSAVIGLACALSIIRLLEHVLEVPGVASTLATMIGLGVGIDYALFIVTRHKLQLARRDGAARVDRPRHRDRRRRRRLRRLHGRDRALLARLRRHPAGLARSASPPRSRSSSPSAPRRRCCRRCSGRSARTSTRCGSSSARPTPTTRSRTAGCAGPTASPTGPGARDVVALVVLVVLALPIFQLELGQNDISALPKDTTSRQAYDGAQQGLRPGRQRAAADRLRILLARRSQTGAAEAAESGRRRRRRRRRHRTDPRQSRARSRSSR